MSEKPPGGSISWRLSLLRRADGPRINPQPHHFLLHNPGQANFLKFHLCGMGDKLPTHTVVGMVKWENVG